MKSNRNILLALIAGLGGTTVVNSLIHSYNQPTQAKDSEVAAEVGLQNIRDPLIYDPKYNGSVVEQASLVAPQPVKVPDYKTGDFSKDSEQVLLARMLFGEAAGCSDLEKIAVGYTAIERANDRKKFNGTDIKSALLKPNQYYCFDDLTDKLKDPMAYEPETFERCLELAQGIIDRTYENPLPGATHYYNPSKANPHWERKKGMHHLGKIQTENGLSEHIFYRED